MHRPMLHNAHLVCTPCSVHTHTTTAGFGLYLCQRRPKLCVGARTRSEHILVSPFRHPAPAQPQDLLCMLQQQRAAAHLQV